MKYKVDGWNNFCRVFQLPNSYPQGFCFHGGLAVNFQMLDWFNPITNLPVPSVSKDTWKKKIGEIETKDIDEDYLQDNIIKFIMTKSYIKKGKKYLVIYDFGGSSTFTA